MEPTSSQQLIRIGDFVFDRSTGEVRSATGETAVEATARLAPQPTKLLELLIGKAGELVTREEIRQQLWPDTHIDFDRSLHFCVRQVRSAFGDSATDPTYVETLPRRGYRLMRSVEPAGDTAPTAGTSGRGTPAPVGRLWQIVAAAVMLAAAAVLALVLARAREAPTVADPASTRLAIMPFELATEDAPSDDLARLAEWLVAELAGGWADELDVVGPRSTAPYSAFPFPDLRRLTDELEVDYVLNARYFERSGERDGESQLIVELIRLDDGAHPWVEFYTDTRSWQAIGQRVRDGVVGALDLAPAR